MTLSPIVSELVAAYEQEHGKRPSDSSIQVCQHIENMGAILHKQGRKEARSSEAARPVEDFIELAQFAFRNSLDAETAQIIGDLWQSDYMDGYQGGGAV